MNSKNAIVIGGSMAGLITARVLSTYFEHVTVLERDQFSDGPEPRKGTPQSYHLHGLLAKGGELLDHYFPGIGDELVAKGAVRGDMGRMMHWYLDGGYRAKFDWQRLGISMSRPLLEYVVRSRVAAIKNIHILTNIDVSELLTSADHGRVLGVRIEDRNNDLRQVKDLQADFVVDCSGRGSASPKWLEQLGYAKAPENKVEINVGYATRMYQRRPDQTPILYMITPAAPNDKRLGVLFPIEGDRWIVSMGGYLGHHCPTDPQGFLEYARGLPAPDIYNLLKDSEPIGDVRPHKYMANLRYHYEKLTHFPEGYLVLGDAVCSFNPVYGQGMTSAALQADALNDLLKTAKSLDGIWRPFFKQAAKVVDIPWQLAVGTDFAYPETKGVKPAGTDFINNYVAKVHRASHNDSVVYAAFLSCMNLLAPPASLFKPNILFRVLRDDWRRKRQPAPQTQLQPASV